MADPVGQQADPSMIGGVAAAPFVLLPDPKRVFLRRAERFAVLAASSPLASYLVFLEALSRVQADLTERTPAPDLLDAGQLERAHQVGMPPIDRLVLVEAPGMQATLEQICEAAEALDKPESAAHALRSVRQAGHDERKRMLSNVLLDAVPPEEVASHCYVAAAAQVFAAKFAATLPAKDLAPVAVGVCPACGGRPVASLVVGFPGAEGVRYAACSCCSTLWNEVRVKCLACGSTEGVGYREVEADGAQGTTKGTTKATIKAEVCDTCSGWVKILYQNLNASIDPVADDVGSLGLDIMMGGTQYRRKGLNPYTIGY